MLLLWSLSLGAPVNSLAFLHGLLLVAAGKCAYVVSNSTVLTKACGRSFVTDVSACCDEAAFVSLDGELYLWNGTWSLRRVPKGAAQAVTLFRGGVLLGWKELVLLGKWVSEVGTVRHGPSVKGQRAFVARFDWPAPCEGALTVINVTNGKVLLNATYGEAAWSTSLCGDLLAVGTAHRVYLYNVTDMKLLKVIGGFAEGCEAKGCPGAYDVAFGPRCALVVAGPEGLTVIEGSRRTSLNLPALSVAWEGNELAVGLTNGTVLVYAPFSSQK